MTIPMLDMKEWPAPVPLDVPYSEKDEAKALGACWNPAGKGWFAAASNIEALQRWKALPGLSDILPGEDRSFGSGLFVDLIPRSCWFTNVRSCVPDREWERIKRMVTKRADNLCEACGAAPDLQSGRMLQVHERWEFDDVTTTQRLKRLICLCTGCHNVTHFGLTSVRGLGDRAISHLMAVQRWTQGQAEDHITAAFSIWHERNLRVWTLDISLITDAGVAVL